MTIDVRAVDSLDDPELEPYRTMRWQAEHRQRRIFVAEGEKVVRRLLESGWAVLSLLLPEKWWREYEPLVRRRRQAPRVFTAEKAVLERLTGFSMYQGVLAVGRVPEPEPLETWLERWARPRFLAAIEGLSNAENVGVVVRNCGAFGVHGLVVGETCASAYLRRAVRSSMGVIFRQPVLEVQSLVETIGQLRQRGIRCLGAHPHTEERLLSGTDLTGECCLVFGSEGEGLSEPVRTACDGLVAVPMAAGVDSLNVASASAVFFYEVRRQWGWAS